MNDNDAIIALKRAQLTEHLEAIEEKLNVPLQARRARERAKLSFQRQPAPWIAGAGAVVVVTGLVAWRLLRR